MLTYVHLLKWIKNLELKKNPPSHLDFPLKVYEGL